jgi:hypothetical protein
MKKLPNSIPALQHRFLAPDDTKVFAFAGIFRLAVRGRVKDVQHLGVSFAEIAVNQGETEMKQSLWHRLFGSRNHETADADAAAAIAAKKEKTLASVNESETTADKPPRVNRTIGLTEARLRARNEQSWKTSTKGWSDFFGRFTTFGL